MASAEVEVRVGGDYSLSACFMMLGNIQVYIKLRPL